MSKKIALLLAVVLLVLSVSGCGKVEYIYSDEIEVDVSDNNSQTENIDSGDEEDTQSNTDTSNVTSNSDSSNVSTNNSSSDTNNTGNTGESAWNSVTTNTGKMLFDKRKGVSGKVHIFYAGDPASVEGWDETLKAFEKEYGVTTKVTLSAWESRDIKIKQLVLSGSSPDYVPVQVLDFPKLAVKGLLSSIDEYIQETDRLDTTAMKNIASWNGKKYAVIGRRLPGCIYYNTTMLKNAGITETPQQLAAKNKWTWNDLKNMARKLTKDTNLDGKPDIYGFGTETDFMFPLSRGVDIVKVNGTNATLNIDDQIWRSSLLFYYDGINKDKIFTPVRWLIKDEFLNGNIAMCYSFASTGEYLNSKGFTTWDVAPFPKYATTDAAYIGSSNSDGFGVAAGATNPIGGIAFGEFRYNQDIKKGITVGSAMGFTEEQKQILLGIENRISWLYGYGMEDSFCQSFGNFMRANGDFTALMEQMRPTWNKNISDTLKK